MLLFKVVCKQPTQVNSFLFFRTKSGGMANIEANAVQPINTAGRSIMTICSIFQQLEIYLRNTTLAQRAVGDHEKVNKK